MTQQTTSPLEVLYPPDPGGALTSSEGWSILKRRGPWRDALRRRMLAVADVFSLACAGLLASALTSGPSSGVFPLTLPVWIVLAKLYGLYDQDHRALRHLTVDELRSIVAWLITGTATSTLLMSIVGQDGPLASYALHLWAIAVVFVPCSRAAARAVWRRLVPAERALLVGSGPLAAAARRKLELFLDIHVVCVGVVDDAALSSHDAAEATEGTLEELADAGLRRVDRIIVASGGITEALIADQVRRCRRLGIKLSVVPPARAMFGTAVQLHHIADLPMIEYSTWDTPQSTQLLKRAMDVTVAVVALIFLSPLLLAVAIGVKFTSRGPVFFRQIRAGRAGKPFTMVKFRTMVAGADARLSEVVDLNALIDPMFKLRSDPRVTRYGGFLRRASIDEIPQLLNVLWGDMSLVGPRPEQIDLVERYAPEHLFRLAVQPGLTGPMQVYGRGELRFDERLAVEREYVENLSLSRDLRLMLLTLAPLFRGRGAY
jgi:exopolysaccharide biosynthesis polyprenyl glycosylphosphotransferase